jgi:hypothetical protein
MPRHTVRQKLIDVSEERTASIFRVDEISKQTTSKKQTESEDGGSTFLRNVGELLLGYTASHLKVIVN